MIYLHETLSAWGSERFRPVLCSELASQDADSLLLQQGLTHGSVALSDDINPVIISISETPACIRVKCGIHYTGIIAGCSCADDPTPQDTTSEYCELMLELDRYTAAASVRLVDGQEDR